MTEHEWLATGFEAHRARLRAVAYRMLGSPSEADDAVQEAWLRLGRSEAGAIQNLGGWLTTVVGRVCLDILRARRSRREEPLVPHEHEPKASRGDGGGAEQEMLVADSVGLALLVVLETLAPAERVTFVLHDMFDLPFDEIAPIVGRSPAAARQLASRARRRVQAAATVPDVDLGRQRQVVGAFLAASRRGDFEALLALLDPEVVLRADRAAVSMGAQAEVRGAAGVAETFKGRALAARLALLNGVAGAVWTVGGRPRVAFAFTLAGGKIAGIDLLADPGQLGDLDIAAVEE